MYCLQCGKEIPEGAKFCIYCGTAVQRRDEAKAPPVNDFQAEHHSEPVEQQSGRGKHKNLIMGIVVGVLIALAVGVISIINGSKLTGSYVATTGPFGVIQFNKDNTFYACDETWLIPSDDSPMEVFATYFGTYVLDDDKKTLHLKSDETCEIKIEDLTTSWVYDSSAHTLFVEFSEYSSNYYGSSTTLSRSNTVVKLLTGNNDDVTIFSNRASDDVSGFLDSNAADEDDLSAQSAATTQTVTSKKLTVATSPDFAPYEFYAIDNSGNYRLAGFDIALAQYIADYLGLELEVIPMNFDEVLAEIANGNVDIAVAGLAVDNSRKKDMDFSDVYYDGSQSFVTIKSNANMFPSLNDINKTGVRIGVQSGSIQADLAEEYASAANIVQMADVETVVSALLNSKVDGAFLDMAVAKNYILSNSNLTILCEVPYDVNGCAVGVAKGNAQLLEGVNKAISAAFADGSMYRFVTEAFACASGKIYEGLL